MIDCNVKIWSWVEYPALKPACSSPMILFVSTNSDILSFIEDVKRLPKQLTIDIPL